MSLPVALGPPSHQGLGLPDLYVHPGIEHIINQDMWSFPLCRDFTGRLLRQSMEALTLEVGLPRCPFDRPIADWQALITPTWLTHTWEFLSSQGWNLVWHHSTLALRAVGNTYLMDLVSDLPFGDRLSFQWCPYLF